MSAAQSAEQATGCYQRGKGLGTLYIDGGLKVSRKNVRAAFLAGEGIEVPNAGAGSYGQFFEIVGIDTFRLHESTSSAGDWVFIVHINKTPHYAFQTNRYPCFGFTYKLGATPRIKVWTISSR